MPDIRDFTITDLHNDDYLDEVASGGKGVQHLDALRDTESFDVSQCHF